MKKIVINSDNRRFNISSIVVGYLDENKTEKIEFIIPDKYKEFGKKACFDANGQKFAKIFDDITGDTLTFTRDITKYKELEMSIEFFKIENEDEIIARTSNLHITIENVVICDDDISPDEPKIIILDKLIEEVTKVGLEVGEKGNYAKEQGDYAKSQAENVIIANTEAIKIINNFENNVEAYTTAFNENANNKTNDFDNNVVSKTSEFNQNVDNKIGEYNNNASAKLSTYNTNATSKVNEYNTNASTKLQEYNTNADNKIAEYDEHSQELDNKIIDTRNELERVKNDVLETGTDTDTYIHLEDSAMAEYQELSVDGVCEQVTTTGANLCDLNVTQNDKVVYNSDGTIKINGSGGFILAFKRFTAKANTKYYIKWELVSGIVDTSKSNGNSFLNPLNNTNIKQDAFKESVVEEDKDISGFWINNMAVFTNAVIRIWFSETQSPFEPYTGGQPSPSPSYPQPISTIENSLKITSCNKNLFDKDNVTSGYRLGSTGDLYEEKGYNTSDFVRVKSNTQYFRNIAISLMECVCTYNDKKEFIERLQSGKSITTNNEVNYIRIVSKDENLDIMQVEENIQETSFEQHLETQITANLPEGEFIGKINDTYKDTLKVEYNADDGQYHLKLYKNIGKVVLNGSENWAIKQTTNDYVFQLLISNISLLPNTNTLGYVISNLFPTSSPSLLWANNINGITNLNDDHYIRIKIKDNPYTTVSEFKTWLSSNPVTVYYVLSTPYSLDLGVVDMPITYNEITNLFTDSDLLPQINAKYYRNFITTIQNLQVNGKALKQELVDINARLSALESASANVVSESEVID